MGLYGNQFIKFILENIKMEEDGILNMDWFDFDKNPERIF